MSASVDVAIDGGQTGVRLGLVAGGRVIRSAEGAGLAYRTGPGPAAATLDALEGPWARLAPPAPVGTVCVGLTSLLGSDAEYSRFAAGLLDRFGARRVLVSGDVVTAHAGALDMRPGVVLAAGTGAIALGIDSEGRHRQVDGWGYLYGDAGGGFWIGRHGLDAAMRGHDGRTPAGPLTVRATEVFGELAGLAERLYPAPDAVARVAGFARHVLDLSDVDPTAAAIAERAAEELASTVAAAGSDAPEVSWTGRLLRHDGLRRRFAHALRARRPAARLHPPAGDGLAGAARLATVPDLGPYADLVTVTTR